MSKYGSEFGIDIPEDAYDDTAFANQYATQNTEYDDTAFANQYATQPDTVDENYSHEGRNYPTEESTQGKGGSPVNASMSGGFDFSKFLSNLKGQFGGLGQKVQDNPLQSILFAMLAARALTGGNRPTSTGGYTGPGINMGLKATRSPITPINYKPYSGQPVYGPSDSSQVTYAAHGGLLGLAGGGMSKQPRYLRGATDGMADKIDTSIDDREPAKLSHGEFVIPADVVSHLGNGNSDAGADVLYKMMDKVRMARTGRKKQGKKINPSKFMPGGAVEDAKYVEGGDVQRFQTGGTTTTTTPTGSTTAQNLSAWAGPYVTDYLSKGQALANTPYQSFTQWSGGNVPLTAGTSPLQQQAYQGLSSLVGGFGGSYGTSYGGGYRPQQQYQQPQYQQQYQPQQYQPQYQQQAQPLQYQQPQQYRPQQQQAAQQYQNISNQISQLPEVKAVSDYQMSLANAGVTSMTPDQIAKVQQLQSAMQSSPAYQQLQTQASQLQNFVNQYPQNRPPQPSGGISSLWQQPVGQGGLASLQQQAQQFASRLPQEGAGNQLGQTVNNLASAGIGPSAFDSENFKQQQALANQQMAAAGPAANVAIGDSRVHGGADDPLRQMPVTAMPVEEFRQQFYGGEPGVTTAPEDADTLARFAARTGFSGGEPGKKTDRTIDFDPNKSYGSLAQANLMGYGSDYWGREGGEPTTSGPAPRSPGGMPEPRGYGRGPDIGEPGQRLPADDESRLLQHINDVFVTPPSPGSTYPVERPVDRTQAPPQGAGYPSQYDTATQFATQAGLNAQRAQYNQQNVYAPLLAQYQMQQPRDVRGQTFGGATLGVVPKAVAQTGTAAKTGEAPTDYTGQTATATQLSPARQMTGQTSTAATTGDAPTYTGQSAQAAQLAPYQTMTGQTGTAASAGEAPTYTGQTANAAQLSPYTKGIAALGTAAPAEAAPTFTGQQFGPQRQIGFERVNADTVNALPLQNLKMDAATSDWMPNLQMFQMDPVERAQAVQAQIASLGPAPTMEAARLGEAPEMRAARLAASPEAKAALTDYQAKLQNYQMGPAERVGTQSILEGPGVGAYMSPYMQNVVDRQQAAAQRQADIQAQARKAQFGQSGAFGGGRFGIENAQANAALLRQQGDIQAQGLQSAFQQGQQQFNTEQQARMQAALANQQAGLTVGQQNLAANLGVQQLGTQTGLQTALANQQAQQQTALANQALAGQYGLTQGQFEQAAAAANQQMKGQYGLTQGQFEQAARQANQQMAGQYGITGAQLAQSAYNLNAQLGTQVALANQQTQYNTAAQNLASKLGVQSLGANLGSQLNLANLGNQQQANLQNLSAGLQTQGLQAQTGLQAQQLNQATGLQALLANQQAGINTGQFNAQMGYNTDLQNAQLRQQQQLANQSLMGQYGLANLGNQQQMAMANLANRQAVNAADQQAANQFALAQAGFGQQAGLQTSAQLQQQQLANQALQGQYGLTNAQMAQQTGMANLANQQSAVAANQQAANQFALAQAGFGQQAGLQTSAQLQQQQLANQALQGQYGMTNAQMAQQMGLANLANQQQAAAANQQALNQFALTQGQFGQQAGMQTSQQLQQQQLANQALQGQYGLTNAQMAQQTGMANLANRQQTELANQALLGQYGLTQGQFGQQAGMQNAQLAQQAALANQQAGLTTGQQNLAARLGVQNLAAQQNLQAQLANQQAGQFGANFGLQANQQQLAAAQALAGIGQGQFGTQLAGLQALLGAGTQQQQTEQAGITALQNEYNKQMMYPYQQLQFQQGLLSGLPVAAATNTPNTSGYQNLAKQIDDLRALFGIKP